MDAPPSWGGPPPGVVAARARASRTFSRSRTRRARSLFDVQRNIMLIVRRMHTTRKLLQFNHLRLFGACQFLGCGHQSDDQRGRDCVSSACQLALIVAIPRRATPLEHVNRYFRRLRDAIPSRLDQSPLEFRARPITFPRKSSVAFHPSRKRFVINFGVFGRRMPRHAKPQAVQNIRICFVVSFCWSPNFRHRLATLCRKTMPRQTASGKICAACA